MDRITRRRFLAGSAAVAASTMLPFCSNSPRRFRNPATVDTQWPIKQVVFLMMENRSFDHMFGGFPGAKTVSVGVREGREVPLAPLPQWLPGDLPHSYVGAVQSINGGKMDGFVGQVEMQLKCTASAPGCSPCATSSESKCLDVAGIPQRLGHPELLDLRS